MWHATVAQTRQLRSLRHLRRLDFSHSVVAFNQLFAKPQEMNHLNQVAFVDCQSDEDAAALANIPTLTKLFIQSRTYLLRHVDFLHHLPALNTLFLGFVCDGLSISADIPRVIMALQTCTKLTKLTLTNGKKAFPITSDKLNKLPSTHASFAIITSSTHNISGALTQLPCCRYSP